MRTASYSSVALVGALLLAAPIRPAHSQTPVAAAPAPAASAAPAAGCPPYADGRKFDSSPIVDGIDTNHDGKMTHEEWQAAGAPEPSWQRFMGYEKVKKQGYITREDFVAETPPNGVDANCDAKITLPEFLEFSKGMGGGARGAPPAGAPGGADRRP